MAERIVLILDIGQWTAYTKLTVAADSAVVDI